MTPYIKQFVSDDDVALLEKIRLAVTNLQDLNLGNDHNGRQMILSCHMLARAIGRVFSLRVVDGFLYPNYQHSWVLTPAGHIIDVYPVAVIGGPILIDGVSAFSPSKFHYIKAKRKDYRGKFGKREFRKAVNCIVKALRKQLK